MSEAFDRYAAIYDALNAGKPYGDEAAYVLARLRQGGMTQSAPSMLEIGCGTGHHAAALAQLGNGNIAGTDASPHMVRAAIERAADLPPAVRDRLSFREGRLGEDLGSARFDVVYCLFHVASYVAAEVGLQRMLSDAKRLIKPGGQLFFDYWHGPGVLREPPSIRVRRGTNAGHSEIVRISQPRMDPIEDLVEVAFTFYLHAHNGSIGSFVESHRLRYLFPRQITLAAESLGFEKISHRAWMVDGEPGVQHWYADCCMTKSLH